MQDNAAEPKQKNEFWKQQTGPHVTHRQLVFDALFGIFIPLAALIVDFILFHLVGFPFFFAYGKIHYFSSPIAQPILVYISTIVSILVLVCWLKTGQLSHIYGLIVSVLFCGAMLTLGIGILLLPFSFVGMVIILSIHSLDTILFLFPLEILVISPFFTAFTYLRNGIRTFRHARQLISFNWIVFTASAILGLILMFVVPAILQIQADRYVSRSVNAIFSNDPQIAEMGIANLDRAFWCTNLCYQKIIEEYVKARHNNDLIRMKFLSETYYKLTGEAIDNAFKDWDVSS